MLYTFIVRQVSHPHDPRQERLLVLVVVVGILQWREPGGGDGVQCCVVQRGVL